MIICPNCQHKELPGALFCSECGAQLVNVDILNTRSIQRTATDQLDLRADVPETLEKVIAVKNTEPNVSLHIIESGQVLHLKDRKEFTLGRTVEGQPILPDVDLSPFDAFTLGVSRLHAAIRIVNREVVVTDLGSSNGTRVNGQKIVPHVDYPINHGDIIAVGKLKIQVIIT
ncbi:MAG: FHA domain-containing protein [Anaerolineaceae bacterium]|nr:FHA domain-containing protein [Anaerolineaceae bacterium]